MHQIKGFVDLFKLQVMGHHFIDFDFATKVLVYVTRQLTAAFNPTESCAAPYATRYELEWPRGDFLSGPGNTDNDRFTPTLMETP